MSNLVTVQCIGVFFVTLIVIVFQYANNKTKNDS